MKRGGNGMPDPTLYLFDGFNVLRASDMEDMGTLVDRLAGFVALHGARGVVVFDGGGEEFEVGPLSVRFAPHADELLERLAAEHRADERVCLVSSDSAIRSVSGQEVMKRSSSAFAEELRELKPPPPDRRSRLGDRLDEGTRERLERLRRGQTS
jgi:predicted RNA-binding protein with PIN domain